MATAKTKNTPIVAATILAPISATKSTVNVGTKAPAKQAVSKTEKTPEKMPLKQTSKIALEAPVSKVEKMKVDNPKFKQMHVTMKKPSTSALITPSLKPAKENSIVKPTMSKDIAAVTEGKAKGTLSKETKNALAVNTIKPINFPSKITSNAIDDKNVKQQLGKADSLKPKESTKLATGPIAPEKTIVTVGVPKIAKSKESSRPATVNHNNTKRNKFLEIPSKIPIIRKRTHHTDIALQEMAKSIHYLHLLHARAKRAGLTYTATIKSRDVNTDLKLPEFADKTSQNIDLSAEYEIEKSERARLQANNSNLSNQISNLQNRLLKEQERARDPIPSKTIGTSLEANIHLRYQYKKHLASEREKYHILELENVKLVKQLEFTELQNLKTKRVMSLDEQAHFITEVNILRARTKELELEKIQFNLNLAQADKKLEKESKEKQTILNQIVMSKRLNLHVSGKLLDDKLKRTEKSEDPSNDQELPNDSEYKAIAVETLAAKKRRAETARLNSKLGKGIEKTPPESVKNTSGNKKELASHSPTGRPPFSNKPLKKGEDIFNQNSGKKFERARSATSTPLKNKIAPLTLHAKSASARPASQKIENEKLPAHRKSKSEVIGATSMIIEQGRKKTKSDVPLTSNTLKGEEIKKQTSGKGVSEKLASFDLLTIFTEQKSLIVETKPDKKLNAPERSKKSQKESGSEATEDAMILKSAKSVKIKDSTDSKSKSGVKPQLEATPSSKLIEVEQDDSVPDLPPKKNRAKTTPVTKKDPRTRQYSEKEMEDAKIQLEYDAYIGHSVKKTKTKT